MNPSRNKAIMVMGTDRSGTSAISGVLSLLGAEVGPDLLPPASDNPRGFYEHSGVLAAHEELLAALGSWWGDVTPLPHRWWEHPATRKAEHEILGLIERDFGDTQLWVVKDPRLCRLFELWIPVFDKCGAIPHAVIMFRRPLEVAASLHVRNGFSPDKSLFRWLDHVVTAERNSRGIPRVFVSYDALLADWRSVSRRIGERLDIQWLRSLNAAASDVEAFLESSLRHHRLASAPWPQDDLARPVKLVYEALTDAESRNEEVQQTPFDETFRLVRQSYKSLAARALIADARERSAALRDQERHIHQLQMELAESRAQLEESRAQLEESRAQLEEVVNSRSWRLTAPLRWVFSGLFRQSLPRSDR